jgi:tetratricopeptide (TPR) repeat protein
MCAALGPDFGPTYHFSMARLVAVLVVLLALTAPAAARQGDDRLDGLFERLQAAQNPLEAKLLEEAIWQIWLESGSPTVDLLMANGATAMSAGDYDKAQTMFDAVVQLDPDYAEGWNKRATLYFITGNYQASIADIEKTLALEPRHFGALSGLGQILERLNDPAGALKAYRRALAADPQMESVRERVKELTLQVKGSPI